MENRLAPNDLICYDEHCVQSDKWLRHFRRKGNGEESPGFTGQDAG